MIVHMRQQIREALQQRFMSRLTDASVYVGRRHPLTPAEIEGRQRAVLIYSQVPSTEESQILTQGGPSNRLLGHRYSLIVDTIVIDAGPSEDVLDATGAEIEKAVDEDVFLTTEGARLTKELSLTRSDLIFAKMPIGQVPEAPVALLRQSWLAVYHTLTGAPHRAA